MIDKRFSVVHSVLLSICISIMTILMILLFIEYRFFCKQAREMIELKQQYTFYVDLLNKKINGDELALEDGVEQHGVDDENEMPSFDGAPDRNDREDWGGAEESSISMDEILAAEASDAPDDDDDYMDDSFVVINRQPEYLKQSTFDYMQAQELNSLMTAIDVDRWSDYTESSFVPSFAQGSSLRQGYEGQARGHGKTSQDRQPIKKSTVQNKRVNKSVNKPKAHVTMQRSFKDCGFILPIDAGKFWLSSLFGPRKRIDGTWGFHHGIDMAAIKGTPVKSARAGTVVEAGFQTGYGNTVVVQHSDALKTRYAHLHTIRVYMGQKVKQGGIVGTVGETGFIRKKGKDGSHLHFEVYEKGKRVNPMHCLPRAM
jgi:murein DD-endopeptidase MepM/ murein hydrolase activator NlpD